MAAGAKVFVLPTSAFLAAPCVYAHLEETTFRPGSTELGVMHRL